MQPGVSKAAPWGWGQESQPFWQEACRASPQSSTAGAPTIASTSHDRGKPIPAGSRSTLQIHECLGHPPPLQEGLCPKPGIHTTEPEVCHGQSTLAGAPLLDTNAKGWGKYSLRGAPEQFPSAPRGCVCVCARAKLLNASYRQGGLVPPQEAAL